MQQRLLACTLTRSVPPFSPAPDRRRNRAKASIAMIDRPTVFVLGAGASAPYGFPLGRPLLEKVARRFTKGSNEFTQALEQVGFEFDWMHRFGKELLTCGRSSIDAFLKRAERTLTSARPPSPRS